MLPGLLINRQSDPWYLLPQARNSPSTALLAPKTDLDDQGTALPRSHPLEQKRTGLLASNCLSS